MNSSIGIIGGADGPTAIIVGEQLETTIGIFAGGFLTGLAVGLLVGIVAAVVVYAVMKNKNRGK